jgi:hypothetical protein
MQKLIMIIVYSAVLNAGTMTVISSGKVDVKELPKQGISIQSVKSNVPKPEYKEVKIKDGNVERIIYIEVIKEQNNITQKGITSPLLKKENKLDKINSHVGLIMKFNINIDIDDFSARFGLKFKTKLESINYYIFENKSEFTDIVLINNILQTELKDSISTIRPNWPLDVELN